MSTAKNFLIVAIVNCLVLTHGPPVTSANQYGDDPSGVTSTWFISQDICSSSSQSCSCSELSNSHTLVNCACLDRNQIVYLKRGTDPNRHFPSTVSLSFRITNCTELRIHPQTFGQVTGPQFDLDLTNIQNLQIMESAFELNPQIISRNVRFNNVSIDTLPSKSFPSSLNIVQFLNSQIRLISSLAFKGKTLQEILFQNSRISLIQSKAFDEEILINNSWIVDECRIDEIEGYGIASSMTNMTWLRSHLGTLNAYSLGGTIPSATFISNVFSDVRSNGLTIKDWTELSFVNNSFQHVQSGGIDLTQHSAQFNVTQLLDNSWVTLDLDFIKVGHSTATPFTHIKNNIILQPCNCSTLFVPQVTLNGSSSWFQQQVWNNSQCLTTPKGSACLGRNELLDDPAGGINHLLVTYDEWPTLCSEEATLCIKDLHEVDDYGDEVISTPPLSGKIRILVIFICSIGLAIFLALLAVICIYICRRDKGRQEKTELGRPVTRTNSPGSNSPSQVHHAYSGLFPNSKLPPTSGTFAPTTLVRPRSAMFEDVEMEDKGVQTLPSDLSCDVLEGLREKLTDPESFWDAKEKIDHLYDLIHVSEDGGSQVTQPDVTVLPNRVNQRSTSTTTHFPPNPPPMRKSSLVPPREGPAFPAPAIRQASAIPTPRYAQIRSKPTRSPALCPDYGNPSDSSPSNIYSELSGQKKHDPVTSLPQHGNTPISSHPQMCDYTEPKDVQAHVYAELSSFPTTPRGRPLNANHHNKTFCVQRPRPIGRLTTPPTVPPPFFSGEETEGSPPCQQRPLPSIPPPFSSTLK